MRLAIREIMGHLPEERVTNAQLAAGHPEWNLARIETLTGVRERRIAADGETGLDLGRRACEKLFERHPALRQQTDALIFCTQSPDYLIPANAQVLHGVLDLPDRVMAFDLNMACSGYIYALMLAQGLQATGGVENILLVTADTYSRYIHAQDRSTRMLFGDGAAVTWLSALPSDAGVLEIACGTRGKQHEAFIIPAGGRRRPKSEQTDLPETDRHGNVRTAETIHMDGVAMIEFILEKVPSQILAVLQRRSLTLPQIDWFVFHQASAVVLDALTGALGVEPDRVLRYLQTCGNTVSASIPLAIEDGMRRGLIRAGDLAVLSGFGAGLSWGTALVRF